MRHWYKTSGLSKGVGPVDTSVSEQRAEMLAQRDLRMRKEAADARVAAIQEKIAALDLDPLRAQLKQALADAEAVAAELAAR